MKRDTRQTEKPKPLHKFQTKGDHHFTIKRTQISSHWAAAFFFFSFSLVFVFLLLYLLWFALIFSPIQAYSMGCCVFVAYIGEYAEMDICWCCFIHFKIANNSRLTHSTDPKHNPPSKQTIWTKDDKKGERNSKTHTDTLNTQFANKLE